MKWNKIINRKSRHSLICILICQQLEEKLPEGWNVVYLHYQCFCIMSGFMFEPWSCNEPSDHYNHQLYYHYQWGSWSKADCSGVLLEQTILHFRFFFPHRRTSLWRKVLVAHYLSTQGDYFSMFFLKSHLCLYVFIKNVIWISDRFYSEMHWSKK